MALAIERGIETSILEVNSTLLGKPGTVVETIILSDQNPLHVGWLDKFSMQRLVSDVRRAREFQDAPILRVSEGYSWGVMRLSGSPRPDFKDRLYKLELAARKAMKFKRDAGAAKASICGAVQELVDNIFEHSEKANSGIVVFLGDSESFEIAIGDSGIGVLASLRTNKAYSFLTDSASALSFALTDGHSRFGREAGRGNGFSTLFRALRSLDAELRFRSGNCALELADRGPRLDRAHASQKAFLQGFVVTLRLRF